MHKLCNNIPDILGTQCGIITVLEKDQYFEIICCHCTERFDTLEEFVYHVRSYHFTIKAEILKVWPCDITDRKIETISEGCDSISFNNDEEICWKQDDFNADEEQSIKDNEETDRTETPETLSATVIIDLIELYRNYPVLWNSKHINHNNINIKNEAYDNIVNSLNEKHNQDFTTNFIETEIEKLNEKFHEEEHLFRTKKRPILTLWYYNNMDFLIKKEENSNIMYPSYEEQIYEVKLKEFEKNEAFNSYLIKIFRKFHCLWNKSFPNYGRPLSIKMAYNYIIKKIKDKWDYILEEDMLDEKITLIRILSKRNKNDCKNAWYYKELEFMAEPKPKDQKKELKNGKPFTCEFCNEVFQTRQKFNDHQFEEYGISRYICGICNKGFKTAVKLKRHSNIHLTIEDRRYSCKICGMKFAHQVNCKVHTRRHTKDYIHQCEECGKKFATSSELKTHNRLHSGEAPFVCDQCGKSFKFTTVFNEHRKTHFKDRIFKCNICSKTFYTQNILRDHYTVHSNIRSHICDLCGKGFKLRKTLRQHKLIHAEQKKYVCKMCGREYAQAAGLHGHMKIHNLCEDEKIKCIFKFE